MVELNRICDGIDRTNKTGSNDGQWFLQTVGFSCP